jgi:hypothetical protein
MPVVRLQVQVAPKRLHLPADDRRLREKIPEAGFESFRRFPLEAATIELLKPLATTGVVIPVADSTFYRMRQNLCKEIRWPENCLRNSYATDAQTFRSSGDVARAVGDAKSTVKRFYVRTLEPGLGKDWFNLPDKACLGT